MGSDCKPPLGTSQGSEGIPGIHCRHEPLTTKARIDPGLCASKVCSVRNLAGGQPQDSGHAASSSWSWGQGRSS